jgi:site-specific recombinase XerC
VGSWSAASWPIVDLDLDVLLVLGKGRRERALPFGHQAALALDRYLHVSDRHKHADLPWLWVGLRGSSAPTVPASARLQVCLCLRWLPLPR